MIDYCYDFIDDITAKDLNFLDNKINLIRYGYI